MVALQTAVQEFETNYEMARYLGSSQTLTMLGKLSAAFTALGMSYEQEGSIEKIVQAQADNLAEIYDFSGKTQETLDSITKRLTVILDAGIASADQGKASLRADERDGQMVDLF